MRPSSICGAQINEIDSVKGPDKFLPHLLGHEALATVIETGPGVSSCKAGDTVVMHWRPGKGMQSPTPDYLWNGRKLNAGWVTTFNQYAVVSENRVTPVPASIDPRSAPLLGCAVTTALGVINNDAQVGIFRTSEGLFAIDNFCPHRGAQRESKLGRVSPADVAARRG